MKLPDNGYKHVDSCRVIYYTRMKGFIHTIDLRVPVSSLERTQGTLRLNSTQVFLPMVADT